MSRRGRGSALVEVALAGVLASALLSGSVFIGRAVLAARRSHAVARYAAALSAAGVPSDAVDAELTDYVARLGDGITWSVGRYNRTASSRFYRLTEAVATADIALPPIAGGGHRTLTSRAVVEEEHP